MRFGTGFSKNRFWMMKNRGAARRETKKHALSDRGQRGQSRRSAPQVLPLLLLWRGAEREARRVCHRCSSAASPSRRSSGRERDDGDGGDERDDDGERRLEEGELLRGDRLPQRGDEGGQEALGGGAEGGGGGGRRGAAAVVGLSLLLLLLTRRVTGSREGRGHRRRRCRHLHPQCRLRRCRPEPRGAPPRPRAAAPEALPLRGARAVAAAGGGGRVEAGGRRRVCVAKVVVSSSSIGRRPKHSVGRPLALRHRPSRPRLLHQKPVEVHFL